MTRRTGMGFSFRGACDDDGGRVALGGTLRVSTRAWHPSTRGVHGLVAPLGHAETDRDALGRLRGQDTWGDAVSWLADAWARAPAVRLLPHRVMAHRVRL